MFDYHILFNNTDQWLFPAVQLEVLPEGLIEDEL
jgi:hypothetical protein